MSDALNGSDDGFYDSSNGTGDPKSIADRVTDGDEPDQGELFVLEQGKKVTLASLYARSTPVVLEWKFTGKAVKGSGENGLISFDDPDIVLVVPARAGKVEIDPTYNDDGSIKHVTLRPNVKAKTVYDARSEGAKSLMSALVAS